MNKPISMLVTFFLISGCASTENNLQFATARSIGNVAAEDVQLKNVDRGMTSVKWDANTKTDAYKCSADDMLRRVYCVKR